ncbi:hypothetical protein [Fodinicola acaciae]|uniref:hypothetical protein n=1 Tax=Fodinicola acaciae TaxID=2681555 RepID=UPI0013D0D7F8|nr:hypothetical protein [Fodinicola acaciae]
MPLPGKSRRRRPAALVAAFGLAAAALVLPGQQAASAGVEQLVSSLTGADGKLYTATNHLDRQLASTAATGKRKEWLVVWAGDENIADTAVKTGKSLPGGLSVDLGSLGKTVTDALPGPDFLAVIDATKGSPTYGKVVNTVTVGPLVENEPHHVQYIWHKGDKIYAGGLFSAATYVFDVKKLPEVSLSGISLPTQTLGGSVPDAYWVLKDGTAYGTYMGGPVVPGPYVYPNGKTVIGNGFAGSPGELVHFDQHGKVLGQAPAATGKAEDASQCLDLPTTVTPTCANPHGIQVREDLDRLITSDYAEPRNIILDPVKAPSPYLRRPTVRIWDIKDRAHPKVVSVNYLPKGPRSNPDDPLRNENRAVMETTVTNLPNHKGAFAETMSGGAIFYTPDITAANPKWREVFDDTTAAAALGSSQFPAGNDGGGWLQTSLDDKYLYHAVIGRPAGIYGPSDPGSPGYVVSLNIEKLLASGENPKVSIDTADEITGGGDEPDAPTIAGIQKIDGGPHWGTLDNFVLGGDGLYHETKQTTRIATSNYFVARTGIDGNHKVCIVDSNPKTGALSLDTTFRDENEGTPCVDFNRQSWPHGKLGNAKPHSELFVVADEDVA